jgi:4'-phosphopantetheinyl transferase
MEAVNHSLAGDTGTTLTDGTIMVCQCRIPSWADETHLTIGLSLLSPHLHPEINRYHRLEDRLARLTARLLLRKALQLFGLGDQGALGHWGRESQGRPFLKGSIADISISHANPWAVTAVSLKRRVGIDVELFRPLELSAIIPYLTGNEVVRIRQAARPEEEALHCWSMREAILKADGRGLLAPEAVIREIESTRTSAGLPWQVESLEFSEGCLYLACDRPAECLRRDEWEFEELLVS